MSSRSLAPLLVLGLSGGFAHAIDMMTEEEFAHCVGGLQQQATDRGLTENTVQMVLGQVSFVPRVIELDRRQPEFTETFGNYLRQRVSGVRIARGREMLEEYRPLLEKLTLEYGVPPQYLIAFWGLETNYGGFLGSMPVLDSLATLACDQRRSSYFTGELMAALELVDGGIDPEQMRGSWAGAMGHTQFMPSAYRRYAVDGDGSGRADLWQSIPDALTSAANFLNQLGWKHGYRWGREVRLPKDFAYQKAGRGNPRPLSQWRQLGVTQADGSPLPMADVEAALLVPAGHRGPSFLVYHNFDIIMRWNRSEFYALSVGHLADRINGAGALRRPPPDDAQRLSFEQVGALQERLAQLGFDAGPADGILGPATRNAVRDFQQELGMIADGHPDSAVFEALEIPLDDTR